MNRERIEETIRLWQAQPVKAKGKPMVIARAEGSKAVMEHGSFSWRTDTPVAGGTNEAPSPTALLLSALAGCAVVFMRDTLAPQLGVTVDAIEATAQCETDARGLLGMDSGRARCAQCQPVHQPSGRLRTNTRFGGSIKLGRSAVRSTWRSPRRCQWRRRSTSSGLKSLDTPTEDWPISTR